MTEAITLKICKGESLVKVKVKIIKDEKMLTYIKMIRSYYKKLSIGEIKKVYYGMDENN